MKKDAVASFFILQQSGDWLAWVTAFKPPVVPTARFLRR